MKTQISKIALVSAFGAALAFAPAMAQDATDPAQPGATAGAADQAASGAVSVTGTVASVEDNGSYRVTVPTQSGSVRDIAVDASAASGAETFSVGDQVTVIGTLDAEQTQLTATSISRSAGDTSAPSDGAAQPDAGATGSDDTTN